MRIQRNLRAIYWILCAIFLPFRYSYSFTILSGDDLEIKAQRILQRHNTYRKCHHASPLIIDKELSAQAQDLANKLAKNSIELEDAEKKYNANIFQLSGKDSLNNIVLENVSPDLTLNPVDRWYAEITIYGEKQIPNHFTQLVWKSSKKLGVGLAESDNGTAYIVCKYDPIGNMYGSYESNVDLVVEKSNKSDISSICKYLSSMNRDKSTSKVTTLSKIDSITSDNISTTILQQFTASLPSSIVTKLQRPTETLKITQMSKMTEMPKITETSKMTEMPKITQTSKMTEISNITETSKMTEMSKITETPKMAETSKMTEMSKITETPKMTESSKVTEMSKITETPKMTETSKMTEMSKITETPKMTESSKVTEMSKITETPKMTETSKMTEMSKMTETLKMTETSKMSDQETTTKTNLQTTMSSTSQLHTQNDSYTTKEIEPRENVTAITSEKSIIVTTETDMDAIVQDNNMTTSINRTTEQPTTVKTEFLKLILILFGLLLVTLALIIVILTFYLLYKIYTCCTKIRNKRTKCTSPVTTNPAVPTTQIPSTVSCIVPVSQRPASPQRSRPGSPSFHSSLSRLY